MTDSLPLSLIISWVVFTGFVSSHQRHTRTFGGKSQGYLLALRSSVFIGSLVGLGLLGYYFMQVAGWYWPIFLFVFGSLISWLLFSVIDSIIGQTGMSILAFIGWPSSAVWSFLIIRGLHP